ncbi:MAG: hypothetical protein ACYCWE_09880 [Eubacteriales bacterium]
MNLKSQYFSQQQFESPPRLFAPVYTWVWNETVTREGIDSQLDSMISRNIRQVYVLPEPKHFRPTSMITSLEPEYLSDEFFSLIRYTADAAAKRGIALWLYDEGGWPSGSACGQVVRNNPALAQKIIRQEKIIVASGDCLTDSKDTLAVFTTDFRRISLPFTASESIDLLLYKIVRGNGPDLLNPDTTDEFIRITHEGYKKAADGDMPRYFFSAFTDEPSVNYPVYPFDPEGFSRRFGYDLCDRLPALFDGNDMGEAGIYARLDYCDYYSMEAATNYYGKIRSWCAENGIFSSGHLNGDDNFLTVRTHGGHMPRHLRCFDIPAIDAIWRQIYPSDKAVNNFFPRFASSAAAQNGTTLAASESFAVYGAGTTYDEMRYALYFQAVRGINLFNFMLISYGNHSFTASQERPCFRPEMPGSGDIAPFNDFTARLSYIAAVGQASHRAALYYPIRDIWAGGDSASSAVAGFEHIGRSLERLQTGFDIIDDDIIRLSTLENGRFVIGSAVYDTVYLPECRYMPDDVRCRLLEFEKQNGQLFYNIAITAPVVCMKPQIKDIRVCKRETDDGDIIYILYNEGFAQAETTITFNESLPAYELDPVNGCIYISSAAVRLSLGCGEGRIFLFTLKELEPVPRRIPGEVFATVDSFEAKCLRRFRLTADGIYALVPGGEQLELSLGDWRDAFGQDFSGDVLYETLIECGEGDFILDLGEVKYTCEAFLDGVSIGIRTMTPYTYYILAGKQGLTKLAVRVSNTAANEYVANDAYHMFTPAQIGPYHARTLKFEEDSLSSGLFGPVTLRRAITE